MLKHTSLALLAASLTLVGCASFLAPAEESIIGSGVLASETRAVSGFTVVNLTSFGDVEITFGDEEAVAIEAEDNLLPLIITEVRGGTLVIRMQSDHLVKPSRPVRYTVIMRRLTEVECSGSGTISVPALTSDQFTVTVSGSGVVAAAGHVERLTANLSSSGEIRLGDLQAASVEAEVSGSGTLTVWPSQALHASVSGSGSLQYYGAPPDLTQEIDGSGKVTKLGEK